MKTALLGIGNILLSDEGIGVRVVEAIQERYNLPDDLEIIDGGTMGLDLLPFIEHKDRLLIVDAVNIGQPPGTITEIEGDDIPRFLAVKMSVHQIGLPDMLSAAKMMGILPREMCLVGIQPEILKTGLEMSETMTANLDLLIDAVSNRLRAWGIEMKEKEIKVV